MPDTDDEGCSFGYLHHAEPWRKEAIIAAFDHLMELQIEHTIRGEVDDNLYDAANSNWSKHKRPSVTTTSVKLYDADRAKEIEEERDDAIRRTGLRDQAVRQIKAARQTFFESPHEQVPYAFVVTTNELFLELLVAQTNFYFFNEQTLSRAEKDALVKDMRHFSMALKALEAGCIPTQLSMVFPFNEETLLALSETETSPKS